MPPLTRLVGVALVIASAHAAGAQSISAADTSVVAWSALTERPRLLDTAHSAHLRFPSILASAHVGGDVHVEMIVGRDGVPERSSIRIVSSTHDLFTNSVRSAMLEWRMSPPTVDGRPVRASVPVFVSFQAPPTDAPWHEASGVVVDSGGLHIALGREGIPPQVGLVASRGDSSAAMIAVLAELFSTARSIKSSATCLGLGEEGRALFAVVLEGLRATHPGVRDSAHCPRTYTSMILEVDSLGKPVVPPNGVHDPVWLGVSKVRPWTSGLFVMTGSVAQGTATSWYQCQAQREAARGKWKATCELVNMTLSLSHRSSLRPMRERENSN